MKALEFLIDKTGALIYPTTVASAFTTGIVSPPIANQITAIFYNTITTNSNGTVTPSDPVTSGMTGTLKLQARPTADSAWSDITNGTLNLATGANMVYPQGVIQAINAICTTITGCNYILIRLDTGA